ncbi:MAG: hypothetical protein V3U92_15230 [Cellulophaga sp.]
MYIKKSELKDLLSQKIRDQFVNLGFSHNKSKGKLIKFLKGGLVMIEYRILNSFNFKKDEISWKVEVVFFIGFEVVHKWFEVFEHRNKSDYKYYWTHGDNLDDITGNKFQIDVDEVNVKGFLIDFIKIVDDNFYKFYKANKDLDDLNKNIIPSSIKTIEDVRSIKSFNIRTAIEFLTIAWILKREDFSVMLKLFKQRIEELVAVGDPMAKRYYPKFDEIIVVLKSLDFSDAILCLEDVPPLALVCDVCRTE